MQCNGTRTRERDLISPQVDGECILSQENPCNLDCSLATFACDYSEWSYFGCDAVCGQVGKLDGYRNVTGARVAYGRESNCGSDNQHQRSIECRVADQAACGLDIPTLATAISVPVAILIFVAVGLLVYFLRRNKQRDALSLASVTVAALPNALLWHLDAARVEEEHWESFGDIFRKPVDPSTAEYTIVEDLFYRLLDGQRVGNSGAIRRVWSVFNPKLASNFGTQMQIMAERHTTDPLLFRKHDWETLNRKEQRRWTKEQFDLAVRGCPWNSSTTTVPILPVVHGTHVDTAWKIAASGFATLSSLDSGYYGSGIYFTSSAFYALPYYADKAQPALLICFVAAGNAFPVVEKNTEANSLVGAAIRRGYQCHYVCTNPDGSPCTVSAKNHYDEIVVSQESQVVPSYILEFDQAALLPLAKELQLTRRATVSGPGSHTINKQ